MSYVKNVHILYLAKILKSKEKWHSTMTLYDISPLSLSANSTTKHYS